MTKLLCTQVRQYNVRVGAGALGDLVFMVREDQVLAATMDVDGMAQVLPDHRRALHMPARSASAPGAAPAGLVDRGRFPQHEVQRIALVRRDLHAGTR
ncbi:hypothetical protein D3C81_2105150 [compost metagenome]